MSFKKNLQQQLKEIGYDKLGGILTLSKKTGISHSTMYDWLNHGKQPHLSSVLKVLKVINQRRWLQSKPSIKIDDLII